MKTSDICLQMLTHFGGRIQIRKKSVDIILNNTCVDETKIHCMFIESLQLQYIFKFSAFKCNVTYKNKLIMYANKSTNIILIKLLKQI